MYVATPLIKSEYFPQDVLLKLENVQPSGSFKSRGMTHLINTALVETPKCTVFCSSGGNAGLAAAEAAKESGVPCIVVVPTTTKQRMVDRIKMLKAEVIVQGSMWSEADAHLRELMAEAEKNGVTPVYCHPFDNPAVWEGHSTLVAELASQIKSYGAEMPSAIVLSCGGGGLYLGIMKGLEKLGWADKVRVVVVETEGAPTFSNSLAAKKPVQLAKVQTVANSLGSSYVPPEVIDYALKYNSESILVSDEQAIDAVKRFAVDHCMIVEPACAATLSVIYEKSLVSYASKGPVVAIVCGGSSWGTVDG